MDEVSSESDADSDELSKELEEELYSVLHHNDFSQGVPEALLEKYSICKTNNELVISLKSSVTDKKPQSPVEPLPKDSVHCDDENTPALEEAQNSSSESNSESDVVVVETDTDMVDLTVGSVRRKAETVLIEDSDSCCSSVEIISTSRKRKLSEGSILVLSDEDFDVTLNTTDAGYDSDGNVSDVVGRNGFEWLQVASPSTWTKEMKKYYNRPSEQLRYFDHKKIRVEIATGNDEDWMISSRDKFPKRNFRPRCLICRQDDHLARNCPKQEPTCHMCGDKGHLNYACPNSICLQCGKKNRQFTSRCSSCSHMANRECFNCRQTGHESRFCPEKWRQFHSTVEGPLKRQGLQNLGRIQCCNCGDSNHQFEQCRKQHMSDSLTSLQAYDWLHGRGSIDNWRYGPSPTGGSPRKRPRLNGIWIHPDERNFDRSTPGRISRLTPAKSKRRKKKRPFTTNI